MARAMAATTGFRMVPPCVGSGWLTTAIPRGSPSGIRSVASRRPAMRLGASLTADRPLEWSPSRGRSVAGRMGQCRVVSGMRALGRVVLFGALLAACTGGRGADATRTAGTPALLDTVIQSDLSVPWDIAFAPDGR